MWTSTALNVSQNSGFSTCVKLGVGSACGSTSFLFGSGSASKNDADPQHWKKKRFLYLFLRAESLLFGGWRLHLEPGSIKRNVVLDQIGFKVMWIGSRWRTECTMIF